jgi:septation ring formation regulator EzrA
MDWTAIACAIAIIGMMGAMFKFFIGRLDKQFEKIDARFEKIDARFEIIDARFDDVDNDLDAIRTEITMIGARLSRLEGQDEERFRTKLCERMKTGKH